MSSEMVYWTGSDPRKYDTPLDFVRYANRELGIEIPVGDKWRRIMFKRLKEEMELHGWSFDDLAKAVRYCKSRKIRVDKVWGLLYKVEEAKKWREYEDQYELQANVAEAMAVETDPVWTRRLAVASGKALAQVYENWRNERGGGLLRRELQENGGRARL